MDRMEAWVRLGAELACADGSLLPEETVELASLASSLAGMDEARAIELVRETHRRQGPDLEQVLAGLGASSPDRAIEGLRWCYRVVVADGFEHAAEVAVLRRACGALLGTQNEERALAFLRLDHDAVRLRHDLEEAAFTAGKQIEIPGTEGRN